jgi:non-ribosomal peptide synthetase component F
MEPLSVAPRQTAKFDLTLSLRENGRRIVGGLEYADALFERSTVERYGRYFEAVLEAMAADETQIVGRLPLLSREERRQLEAWNRTDAAYPREACVHELFEAQAQRTPDAIAVAIDETCVTYGDVNRRANQLAAHLRGRGVQPDTRVGICLEPSLEMVVGVLAIMKAGGAYVPLDPAYPAERLTYMIADSGVTQLLTDRRSRDLVAALAPPTRTSTRRRLD